MVVLLVLALVHPTETVLLLVMLATTTAADKYLLVEFSGSSKTSSLVT